MLALILSSSAGLWPSLQSGVRAQLSYPTPYPSPYPTVASHPSGSSWLEAAGAPSAGRYFRRAAVLPAALATVLALASLTGCDRPEGEPHEVDRVADTVSSMPERSLPETARTREEPWEWDVAPWFVLPTVDGGLTAGSLLRPGVVGVHLGDTTGLGNDAGSWRVELFARSGLVGLASVSIEPGEPMDPACPVWPVARLRLENGTGRASSGPGAWTAAFPEGRIVAIPLDSIEGMAPRDSSRLAADLAGLASALPEDSGGVFRGLPFVVLRAYRSFEPQKQFVIATLIRRINQEDSPLEERLVLVADALTPDARRWRVGWHERASGTEDELLVAEPLLAFRARGNEEIRVLFGRDDGFSLSAAVLARGKEGWHLQWESPASGCDVQLTGTPP